MKTARRKTAIPVMQESRVVRRPGPRQNLPGPLARIGGRVRGSFGSAPAVKAPPADRGESRKILLRAKEEPEGIVLDPAKGKRVSEWLALRTEEQASAMEVSVIVKEIVDGRIVSIKKVKG